MVFQKPVFGGTSYYEYYIQSAMLGNFQMKTSTGMFNNILSHRILKALVQCEDPQVYSG